MKMIMGLVAVLGMLSVAQAEDQQAPVVEPVDQVPATAEKVETAKQEVKDAKVALKKAKKDFRKSKKQARKKRKEARRAKKLEAKKNHHAHSVKEKAEETSANQ